MRLRIEADTQDVEAGLRRTQQELQKLHVQTARSARSAARMQMVTSGIGLGTAAYGAYAAYTGRRTVASLATAGARRAAATAAGGGLAGRGASSAVGLVARFLPVLAAIAAGILALRSGIKWARRAAEATEQQSKIMAAQLRTSIRTEQSLARITTNQAMSNDPFGRGAAFHQGRTARYGLAPSAMEAGTLGMYADAASMNTAAGSAAERARASVFAPYQTQGMRLRALLNSARAAMWRQQAELGGTGGGLGAQVGRLGTFGMNASAGPFGNMLNAEAIVRRGLNWWQGGEAAEAAGRQAQEANRQRRYDLFRLEQRGPDRTSGPAPGFRAGTAEEYAFRVQQQSIARNREATIRWQNQVLVLLEQMVAEGQIDREVLISRQLEYGRTPSPVVE